MSGPECWMASSNGGPSSLEHLATKIAAYKPTGTFDTDYGHFCALLEIKAHPQLVARVEEKTESKEEEEEETYYSCAVRNFVLDVGSARALSCALPLSETMSRLVLYNAGVEADAFDALCGALPKSRLRTLSLDYNGSKLEPKNYARLIAGNPPFLQSLSLRGNDLGDEGASAIAEGLPANLTLIALNLFGNGVGEQGAQAIFKALRLNVALKSLSLSNNNIKEEATLLTLFETLTAYELTPETEKEHLNARNMIVVHNKNAAASRKKKPKDPAPAVDLFMLEAPFVHADANWARGNEVIQFVNISRNGITDVAACAPFIRNRQEQLGKPPIEALKELNLQRNAFSPDAAAELHDTLGPSLLV